MIAPEAVANVVDSQVTKIQIPLGLKPGDSFIVTPANGRVFTVIVPEGASGGGFIEVIVPDEAESHSVNGQKPFVQISKATVGAAVLAGVVGAIVVGPVVGLVMAGGAAYATTREHGKIGETSRKVGNSSYKGMVSAKNWVEKKVNQHSGNSSSSGSTTSTAGKK